MRGIHPTHGPKRTNRNQQRERLTSNEVAPCWFVSVGLLHRDFIAGSESPRGSLRFTAAGRSSIYVDGLERRSKVTSKLQISTVNYDSRSACFGVSRHHERFCQRIGVPGSIVTDTVDEHRRCTIDAASHATHEVFVDA